ncbi:TonB-dependent receptor [Novosphingobium sp. CF614]|uniref:TonB-dependent receptor n=1 Tax=Novosphingobium sp. CF614 TaxID=1884364 RepID=UPI0008E33217|nr:TonB-dependent receptor [Novosphingobium sp. CF614]SFF85491.1 TonB-dependent receptor [Novosphingobium sp. CF614]
MRLGAFAAISFTSVLAIAAASVPVHAQSTETSVSDGSDADVITVTGIRASLRDALQAKRASANVVETISSKDIGALPDVTIADELARLPGVTATRDRGNASQAVVRGLGPRLVLGLVNGREVASSEPDRNVRWEIYPSEIVSAVTVYKSQSADLIAGGVAATIDIQTNHPLDYSGPALTVRGGALYNDGGKDIPNYSGWGMRGSAQYVAKLSDTLGLLVGGTYQKQKNGYPSFQGWGYNTPDTGNPPTLDGNPINAPWGAQTEVKALTETRWSATGALQWKPDDRWDVNLDFLYSNVKIDEHQFQQWYGRSNGWGDWGGTIGAPGDIYQNGSYTLIGSDIVAADLNNYSSVTNVLARYTEDKSLLATGFNAKYSDDDWTVKFDGSYSRARRHNIWQAVTTETYPASTSFSTGAGHAPSVTTSNDPADPAAQTVPSYYPGLSDGPQYLNDTLGAGQIDIYHNLADGFFTGFGAGLRYSNRVKSFHASTSSVSTNTGSGVYIPSIMLSGFSVNGSGGFIAPNLLYGSFEDIAAYALTFGTPAEDPSRYWRVREDDFEGYIKADFAGSMGAVPFTGNLGVRFVSVDTHSYANQGLTYWDGTQNVTSYSPVVAYAHYFRALPSLNVNFDLTEQVKLRAGVARVISRPPLDELRASRSLSYYPPSYLAGSGGNPNLKPFMATQGDLSLEWYFGKDALLAVAGYYKKVDTNIGYTSFPQEINGTTYTITGPANGPGGHILGAEATFQMPFSFIPGLENFGVYSNVALVDSNIKELAPASNPFNAVGLAKFTGEVDLWYSHAGLDARVALKHHTPFTVIYGWDASQLTRLESETTLGASISYEVVKNVTVRLQANNLTNQAARFYWNNDPQQLARFEKYGRSYLMDLTIKY